MQFYIPRKAPLQGKIKKPRALQSYLGRGDIDFHIVPVTQQIKSRRVWKSVRFIYGHNPHEVLSEHIAQKDHPALDKETYANCIEALSFLETGVLLGLGSQLRRFSCHTVIPVTPGIRSKEHFVEDKCD